MSYRVKKLIEQKLKHILENKDSGRISNLNELPAKLLEEARLLDDDRLSIAFLAFYCSTDNRPYLESFVEDVVFHNEPVDSWRRGRVLVPDFSLSEQLRNDRSSLLALFTVDIHFRIRPRFEDWDAGVSWVGAPALPQPDANYRSSVPPNAVAVTKPELDPCTDMVVMIRRWIAARLARVLRQMGKLDSIDNLSDIASASLPMEEWSPDAMVAAKVLLRELKEFGLREGEVPGFRAPDDWYYEQSL